MDHLPLSTDENPTAKSKKSWQSDLAHSSPSLGFGVSLAGSVLFYVLAGYLLDRWLDTEPWFILIGSGVGMVAFFIQLARLARRLSRGDRKKESEEK
ncbi:MAG: AtpZ/AtpI family protein [Bacteroidetes bacterium]|nr:MAG: AtpZ/AtpI family protein [Bacteroidota bacterium]